jgi:hypothetical protein
MVYLQAYFDESGKFKDKDVISFCGFAGTTNGWASQNERWEKLLKLDGMKELKARKALRPQSPLSPKFKALGTAARIQALIPFIDVLRYPLEFGISGAIDAKAFRELPADDQALLDNDPHYLAFRKAMAIILHRTDALYPRETDIRIGIVCDEESGYSVECLKIFTNLRSSDSQIRKRFVGIGFADDHYFPQLQGADFLAGIARLEASRRFFNLPFDLQELYDKFAVEIPNAAPVFGSWLGKSALLELVEKRRRDKNR